MNPPSRDCQQLWVLDERNKWTPAIVCEPSEIDADVLLNFGGLNVLCVRLYSDLSQVYTIFEPSEQTTRPLRWDEFDRGDATWVTQPNAAALALARRDGERLRGGQCPLHRAPPEHGNQQPRQPRLAAPQTPQLPSQPLQRAASTASPVVAAPRAAPPNNNPAYTKEDIRRLEEYLQVLSSSSRNTAEVADIRLALDLIKQDVDGGATRAATRNGGEAHPNVVVVRSPQAELLELQRLHNENQHPIQSRPHQQQQQQGAASPPQQASRNLSNPPPRQQPRLEHTPPTGEAQQQQAPPPPAAATEPAAPPVAPPPPLVEQLKFHHSCNDDELNELRQRITTDSLVDEPTTRAPISCLDPCYRVRAIMGALAVEGLSCRTKVSTPQCDPHRPVGAVTSRVLIVALGEAPQYDPQQGWMEPLVLDDVAITMRVAFGNRYYEVPQNWKLPSTRSFDGVRGVKTLIPIDVSDSVAWDDFNSSRGELNMLNLGVFFSAPRDLEMDLWYGTLVALLVDVVPLNDIVRDIAQQYVPPSRLYRASANFVSSTVKLTCPLSSRPLQRPCRGQDCEHYQCVELESLLENCMRRHLWECPICHVPVPISKIAIDESLQQIIDRANGSARSLQRMSSTVIVSFEGTSVRLSLQEPARQSQRAIAEDVDDD